MQELLKNNSAKCVVIGFAAGLLAGLVGIGGGIIMVPAMVYFLGKEQHEAHGTSLFVIIFTAFIGGTTYSLFGHMDLTYVMWIAVGGLAGAYLGASIALYLPEKTLRSIFGWTMVIVAIKMFWG
ncbi:MAG: sulfite exporter TauE/SafE family protein [bacterium]